VSVTGQAFWCSADGETYGPERNRTWHVEPGAFSMALPA
jgi:diacylglycerol kinase (ATP)